MECRLSPAEVAGDALASVRMIASAAAAGPPLYHSPLYDRHVGLGAKMADFGGWEMPIEYPDGGVLKEHTAVRQAVGIFDVSNLGKGGVRGRGAREPRRCRDG